MATVSRLESVDGPFPSWKLRRVVRTEQGKWLDHGPLSDGPRSQSAILVMVSFSAAHFILWHSSKLLQLLYKWNSGIRGSIVYLLLLQRPAAISRKGRYYNLLKTRYQIFQVLLSANNLLLMRKNDIMCRCKLGGREYKGQRTFLSRGCQRQDPSESAPFPLWTPHSVPPPKSFPRNISRLP